MLRTHESRYAEQLDMVYKGNRLTKVSKSGGSDIEYDLQGYPEKFECVDRDDIRLQRKYDG